MENYELFLPSYSVGNAVYGHMAERCKPYGTKAVVIGGHTAMSKAEQKLRDAAQQAGIQLLDFVWFGGDCTWENVEMLKNMEVVKQADMIFAVGGGKALDTGKCLGVQTGQPVFTFPTIASNCAACTTVSIMYHADGTFAQPYFFLEPAKHAFLDTDILAGAPERYLWAGIGDTYAKYYEATVSAGGDELPHFTATGVGMSRLCLEPLLAFGEQAMEQNRDGHPGEAFEQTALTVIVTTAIVSIFLTRDHTPDFNSGLAHAVFYSLTAFPHIERDHLHGEVVAFGALLLLLCDGQREECKKIYDFHRKIKLPVRLSDLDLTPEQFEQVVEDITKRSDIQHYPYAVTVDMLHAALAELEEMGCH